MIILVRNYKQLSHALCNIVEIHELVILIMTLALVTHTQINKPSLG